MNVKTESDHMVKVRAVSLFGHRYIENIIPIEDKIKELAEKIIEGYELTYFFVGRDGDFDRIASSVIKKLKNHLDDPDRICLIWMLPYYTAEYRRNEEAYDEFYDLVHICPQSEAAHFKSAYEIRNRCMVDGSDIVICYVGTNSGGAYKAMKYAEKMGKKIINIFDS